MQTSLKHQHYEKRKKKKIHRDPEINESEQMIGPRSLHSAYARILASRETCFNHVSVFITV